MCFVTTLFEAVPSTLIAPISTFFLRLFTNVFLLAANLSLAALMGF
jgi:hypothetical protein